MKALSVACDGLRLAGRRVGKGPPLLLVHGWSQSSRLFHRLAERLSATNTVYGYNLRGHGMSDKPGDGYTLGQLTVDLHHVLRRLGSGDDRIGLFGHSMGCAVIWKYIDIFGTDGLSSLIILDQSPRVLAPRTELPVPHPAHLAKMDFATLQARVAALRSPFTSLDYVDAMFTDRAPDDLRELALTENHRFDRSAAAALLWDAALHDWRRLVAEIASPTLAIGNALGAHPVADLRGMAEAMPDGEYTDFSERDGGGHMIILENPDAVEAGPAVSREVRRSQVVFFIAI